MIHWWISKDWQDRLTAANLGTFEDAFRYQRDEEPLSDKSSSRTWGVTLPDGQRIFVKQDTTCRFRTSLRALFKFQQPHAATQRERLKMERLKKKGFHLAEVIAYGEDRSLGFPKRAVMITLPVPGRSVEDIILDDNTTEETRQAAVDAAIKELGKLQEAHCNWGKDCKPEHFFYAEDGTISIIDVERMKFPVSPLGDTECIWQRQHFMALLPHRI